jgi:hypothetical protein
MEGAYVGYLVEDRDVQTIQNNFRMDGFYGLNVTAMGHLMVLLWSDKIGVVKKVVETVGLWCSLFEKVIPWSSEVVSNQRAAWLRCSLTCLGDGSLSCFSFQVWKIYRGGRYNVEFQKM